MRLKLPVIALFVIAIANFSAPAEGPGEFVGHWNGIADGQISFSLDIELDGTDLVAELNVVDQGMTEIASDWTEFDSDHNLQLSFDLPNEATILMAGQLNDEGKMIGTYEMGEQVGSFTATKKETDG